MRLVVDLVALLDAFTLVGELAGLLGEVAGLVGEVAGLIGEVADLVGEVPALRVFNAAAAGLLGEVVAPLDGPAGLPGGVVAPLDGLAGLLGELVVAPLDGPAGLPGEVVARLGAAVTGDRDFSDVPASGDVTGWVAFGSATCRGDTIG